MKYLNTVLLTLIIVFIAFAFAFAAGDVKKGKILFDDPSAFGGKTACSQCHPNGNGLEEAGGKKEFHIAGMTQKSLEEAVNACIENASKGKAIDPKSERMQDITAYIRSLGKKK